MGIGLPGAGKTTALKPFAERYNYEYVSPDEIREEISGDAIVQTDMQEVWNTVRQRTAAALDVGKIVIVDATFVKGDERRDFIHFAREHGADKVQGVFANVALGVSDERNQERERTVPRYAMERMDKQLAADLPYVEDGFDSVIDINEFQELTRAEMNSGEKILEKEFKHKFS